jgi:rRNA-processing protein Efg1
MPPSARTAAQAEVESLKALAAERSRRERERTLAKKYHMVKFFERRKIQRRLEALTECAGRPGDDTTALTARRKELEDDLLYIRHFPKDKPYVALYPSDGHSEVSRSAVEAIRREIQDALSAGGGEGEGSGAINEKLKEEETCEDDFFLPDADDKTL